MILVIVNCVPRTAGALVKSLQATGGVKLGADCRVKPAAFVGHERISLLPLGRALKGGRLAASGWMKSTLRRRIRSLPLSWRAPSWIRRPMRIRSQVCRLMHLRPAFIWSSGRMATPLGANRMVQPFLLPISTRTCAIDFSRWQPTCSCDLCRRPIRTLVHVAPGAD